MAKRRQYNFRATPTVEAELAAVRSRGESQTIFINAALELAIGAHAVMRGEFWKLRAMAEAQGGTVGTLLGRLALAGLKGGKR